MAMMCGWKILWSSKKRIRRKPLLRQSQRNNKNKRMKRARRGSPGARFPAARLIFPQAGFSVVAFVPGRSLPACWIPARAVAHGPARVRVVSPAFFRFWSWAGSQPEVSQMDAGDTYPHLLWLAEQISQEVAAVAPVVCVPDPIVAAAGRAPVAGGSHLAGAGGDI